MEITITPVSVALFFGAIACIVAIFLREKHDGYLAARHLVENQNRQASEDELDAYLELAEGECQRDDFLRELAAIRRAYGHLGVKLGHLAWIDLKLAGRLPPDATAPAFDQPDKDESHA